MASRAISAIRGIGRSPQPPPPRRGRSSERPTEEGTESGGDGSERSNSSDVYYNPDPPRVVGRGRTIPTPPTFIEEAFEAGVQAGIALHAQQTQQERLYEELDFDFGAPMVTYGAPRSRGEPDPEEPGGGTDPSESDDTGNQGDGSEYPDHTDTDPYESSQAEVEQSPDIECIDIDEPPEESYYAQRKEKTSTQDDAPQAATESVPSATPEPIIVDENKPEQPTTRAPISSAEAFTGSISQMASLLKNPRSSQRPKPAEPEKDQTPEQQALAMAGEESAPQAETSEAAPSQEAQNESSNPQQGEGESSSTSQAAPAETSASSAQEAPKSSPAEQQPPKEKKDELPSSVPKSLMETMSRRRKPISKPPQESKEEKEAREERERIERIAADKNMDELVDQEDKEKKKLSEKEAKSRRAAASNTERAREAAERMKKKKEDEKATDKLSRAAAKRIKKVPEQEDGDPPDDGPTPWTVYTYKQPQKVKGEYTYDGVIITNKWNAVEPRLTVNTKATVWGRGKEVKPIDQVTFLQKTSVCRCKA